MSTRTSALDALVFGVDVQSGDVRGDAPSYALVVFDGEVEGRDVVSRRKLLRLVEDRRPAILATDNMYELAADKDALVGLLGSLPDETSLVQVTGDERPEPLSRVASRHGVPYGKAPMKEAEAAARLAAANVGHEVSAFTDTTTVKVARGRATGKGGWSEDRFTRRIHGSVRRRTREVESTLDAAGLSFEQDVTEKYGGYANAVFSVDARPSEIPISASRSGDVRVEIERERRDGIEFRPLVKRRDHVVVGIDPGTTTAIAVADLDGEVLDVHSTRTADTAAVIEWVIERGRPVVVAADVTPMPEAVEKIRRSFEAAAWSPPTDLPVDEKQHRTRDYGYENDHERDALAATLFAYDDYADQFDRIAARVPPGVERGAVVKRVVAGEDSVEAALADLTATDESEEPGEGASGERTGPPSRAERELRRRVDRLETYVEELESTIDDREETIEDYERKLAAARSEERREARESREINRLERENERLERQLAAKEEETAAIRRKLERLKTLWRLDHSNFADVAAEKEGLVSVKPIEKFTLEAIEAADEAVGLATDDVILLRDASGAGRPAAERLAAVEPRIVLRRGGLSRVADEVLFEEEVPVAPADEVAYQEIDDLAVAREDDVEIAVDDWRDRLEDRKRDRKAEMVDQLISEHRATRRG